VGGVRVSICEGFTGGLDGFGLHLREELGLFLYNLVLLIFG
jgi:hypothetical protein